MGNLTSNLNQNIQDFANQLIEQERSKNNSLNQSHENEEDKYDTVMDMKHRHLHNQQAHLALSASGPNPGGGSSTSVTSGLQGGGIAFYSNLAISQKSVRVLIDDGIQFDLDIPSDSLTCGWLISEVTRLYGDYLRERNRLLAQYSKQHPQQLEKDFHQIIQMSRRQQLNFKHGQNKSNQLQGGIKKEKQKLIVALKTYDQNESIDHWLTMYDRGLTPLQDGEVLIAHFAKIASSKRKTISAGDFEMIKVIGRGGFSRVLLCRKKDTGRLYAMKILKKSKIIREKKIKPILSERAVLEQLDHPFIIKLHWAFQSKEELFFILDICTGGEIFFHLNNFKRFPEQLAKFYFSEILLGLEYLHAKDIVYRDIKPENILIDIEGHIKIADFGLAKIIPTRQKSFSFCGSPEYMSPEMLKGRGHDKQLDYYCLGALLYEMLTGLPPYYSKDTNQMYIRILNDDLSFPDFINRQHPVVDLLTRLLAKDPRQRIQNVEEIKQHAWLREVKWDAVMRKEVPPPFVPSIRESNFDPEFNELPMDFDEQEMKLRLNTERRQSYYIESTVQSKNCTENSFYFNQHPGQQMIFNGNNGQVMQFENQQLLQQQDDSRGEGGNGNSQNQGSHQAIFNNFFANPGDDVKDIYNDSSGTNNTNNSIQNIKHKQHGANGGVNNSNTLNNQSNRSNMDDSDLFRNFSFYDSPLEENEILTQIKRCCIKIGQLPQHLYSTQPNISNQNGQYQKQLNTNLHKLQTHMQQWMPSARGRLICEEQDEEDESSHQKSSQNKGDQQTLMTVEQQQQLHALPSESGSSSIIIEHTDIAIMEPNPHQSQKKKQLDIQEITQKMRGLQHKKESIYNQKNMYAVSQALGMAGSLVETLSGPFHLQQQQHHPPSNNMLDDFNNQMGSFSSKSINTYDESNQSVAQEFKTNESIAMQTYSIANMNQQAAPIPNQKLMNSDEIQKFTDLHRMIPQLGLGGVGGGGHTYKKSMINPTMMRPPLEIQLPEHEHEMPIHQYQSPLQAHMLYGSNNTKQKQDTSKTTTAFLPNTISPNKRELPLSNQNYIKSPNNLSSKDIQSPLAAAFKSPIHAANNGEGVRGSFQNTPSQMELKLRLTQQQQQTQSPMIMKKHQEGTPLQQQAQLTTQSTTQYTTTGATVYKFQTPDSQNQQQEISQTTKKSFLQESVQQLNKQYQEMLGNQNANGDCGDEDRSPDQLKKVAFQKRSTAKFRSMDLTSQSLGRINKLQEEKMLQQQQQQIQMNALGKPGIIGVNKDWKASDQLLADLKEVSLEGGHSISLSPQRSYLPDFTPNPGNKIQTLKKSKIQQAKATKTLKAKQIDVVIPQQHHQDAVANVQLASVNQKLGVMGAAKAQIQIPSSVNNATAAAALEMKKKARPNNLKIDSQTQASVQAKYGSNQPQANQQQQLDEKPGIQGKLSSKNSNQKPNLFSEKSSSNLQIGSPMAGGTSGTPTQNQGVTQIPSTLKGKFDFFGAKDMSIHSSLISGGTTKVQTPASATLGKPILQSPQNAKAVITKKLQQQIETGSGGAGGGMVSRNDNPKITTSAGLGSAGQGGSIGTPGLKKNQSTVKKPIVGSTNNAKK